MLAVTGITGHTGRYFIKELQEKKYDDKIKCLVRSSNKVEYINGSGLNFEIIEGNLDNEEDIFKLLDGVDTVLHIANIHYSPEIVRIGKLCGVKRFILVHTTGIFSKYKSASASYIDIENQIIPLMKEFNITILRPTMIFGDMCDYNISKFIKMVDKLYFLPIISNGSSLIQPVNARDLAKAYYNTLMSNQSIGNAYDLSGDRPITIKELYRLISDNLGKKRVIISFPMWLCIFCAKIIYIFTLKKVDLIEKVMRMGEDRSFSHEKATCDFLYEPESFEIGLRREINEYILNKKR